MSKKSDAHLYPLPFSAPQAGLTSEHLKASSVTGTQAVFHWIGATTKLLGQCGGLLNAHAAKFLLMGSAIRRMSKRALASTEPLSAPLYVFSAAGGSNAPLPAWLQKLVVRTFELGGSNVVLNCVEKFWNRSASYTMKKTWCATAACYNYCFPEVLTLADTFEGLRWSMRSSTAAITLVAYLATGTVDLRSDVARLFKKLDANGTIDPADAAAITAYLAEHAEAVAKQPRSFSTTA